MNLSRRAWYWALYDLANTMFSAMYVSFLWSVLLERRAAGGPTHLGYAYSISMLATALISPWIGAMSDRTGRRLPVIVYSTLWCCAATALTPFCGFTGMLLCGVLANFTYQNALGNYNALLPDVSTPATCGYVSTIGTALGYGGTLLILPIAYGIQSFFGWQSETGLIAVFPVTALLFAGFSMPLFLGVRDRAPIADLRYRDVAKDCWHATWRNLAGLLRDRPVRRFLLSQLLYSNALNAVLLFLWLFSSSVIGVKLQQFYGIYFVITLGTGAGTWLLSGLPDRFGSRRVLLAGGAAWVLVIGILLSVKTVAALTVAGSLGGVAMGMIWSAQRPRMIELVPAERLGEYFGILALVGKMSGIAGPAVFEFVSGRWGYSAALLTLLPCFGAGMWLLREERRGD